VIAPQLPTAPVSNVAATAEAAPPTPAPPPAPAEQLVEVMRPLRRAEDGAYHLRLELRPPELGRVDLRVEIRDGVLHADISTEHAHAADLVRNALNDLRARLDANGVRAGALTVGDGRADAREREANATPRRDDRDDTPSSTTNHNRLDGDDQPTNSDALLDVRI
jgi:flagellar hook-length control protein FliK